MTQNIPTRLRVGDLVEVKSSEEILSTLNENGALDNLPFMQEMIPFCGKRLRVVSRAHKTCDTVNNTGGRRVVNGVHLEDSRCDGSSHGECHAACLLFWKEDWLKRVDEDPANDPHLSNQDYTLPSTWALKPESKPEDIRYRCQATELPEYSTLLHWWDIRQYLEDLTSGNIGFKSLFYGFSFAFFRQLITLGVGHRYLVRTFNFCAKMRGTSSFPFVTGKLTKTPVEKLNLEEGETVRVKSFEEIVNTLDHDGLNRGMGFDREEMRVECGKTHVVHGRVERLINEQTGKMMVMQTPCIRLAGVFCSGLRPELRLFCPRAIPSYWREIWLERVSEGGD